MTGSAEVLWSKTLDDIEYQQLNIVQPAGAAGINTTDGRPLYLPVVPSLTNVILLTNVTSGHTWSAGYSVHRALKSTWSFDASYLYGQAFIPAESQSSVALTSWQDQFTSGDPNNPPMAISDFDPGHRISGDFIYQFHVSKTLVSAALYYSGQSGHPYTISYSSDANGDKQGFNDNLFLPNATQAATMTFTNGTYQDLLNFLPECASSQAGSIMARNSCRAPWINNMDLRLSAKLPVKKVNAELTLDILNLLNLLDDHWGLNAVRELQPVERVLTRHGPARGDHGRDDAEADDGHEPGDDHQPDLHEVRDRRRAFPLADAGGRAHPVLINRSQAANTSSPVSICWPGSNLVRARMSCV